METWRVGLIGCGNIGSRLARSLLGRGWKLTVFDREPAAMRPLVEAGAVVGGSYRDVAAASNVILLSLPNSAVVEEVVYGQAGLLSALQPHQVLVDMTTSLPQSTRRIAADLAALGVAMLDAPVTLSGSGLSVMAGGRKDVFERLAPLFDVIAAAATWVGPAGAGHTAKLCQNTVTGVYTAVAAEVLVFAMKAGVDPDPLEKALLTTGAGPAARLFPALRQQRFAGTGQMALHAKDMRYTLETAAEIGAWMPLATALYEAFQRALERGDPLWTQLGVVTAYEREAGLTREGA